MSVRSPSRQSRAVAEAKFPVPARMAILAAAAVVPWAAIIWTATLLT